MLRYRYAWSDSSDEQKKRRVDVLNLEANGGKYTCMGCGKPMQSNVLGTVRGKYFSHAPGYAIERNCAETYLHIVAKNIFYWTFRERRQTGQPFYFPITLPYFCGPAAPDCQPSSRREYQALLNVIEIFDQIKVEKRHGAFIPDLLLSSTKSDQQLFVEIYVKSPCSPSKISAGIPILELPVKNETDLDRISNWDDAGKLASYHLERLLLLPSRDPNSLCFRCPLRPHDPVPTIPPKTYNEPAWVSQVAIPAASLIRKGLDTSREPSSFVDEVIAVFGGRLLDDDEI